MRKAEPSRRAFLGAAALLPMVLALPAMAQSKERVKFAKGNDNAAVDGVVKGGSYRDYILGAKAGQTMAVSLITQGSAFFNIMPPGATYEAIYNSSIDGNDAVNVRLPKSGDYTIRVYLMGDDDSARRSIPYTLSLTIM